MKIKKDFIILSIILLLNAIGIILYFKFLQYKYKKNYTKHDALNKKIIDIPIISKNCCSWWPISHFVFFTIYSYMFPQYSIVLFIYGVLWEIIEIIINIFETKKGEIVKHQQTRNGDNIEYVTWWSGSYKDILFNLGGIIFGRIIKTLL